VPAHDLSPEEFRRIGHEVVEWVARYRESLGSRPVREQVEPGWVRGRLPDALPERGDGFDALLRDLDDVVVPGLVHWQHPSFFGYFPANASLASVLGDLLSTGIGVQGMLWSTAPAATELEQHLTHLLVAALGLPDGFTAAGGGGGMITEASSSANLVALLAALHRAAQSGPGDDWRRAGTDGRETVYVSEHTHSSVEKAARMAGLGSRAVRVVPSEPLTHAMDADALAELLLDDLAAGYRPVMVCATVGTTSTGAVDPVRAIGELCVRHGIWLHVDAAWAGAATVCPELRYLVDGLEYADSYCADAHKWLLTAFDCTLFWTSRPGALAEALSVVPEYLRNAASESGEVVDYRDWQVPLGRRFRAVKLWAVLRWYGLDGLREHIRGHVELAAEFASWVEASPRFELATPPSLGLVCLRDVAGDEATRAVLEQVNATGRALLTHTVVDGRYLIRVAIGGLTTRREHVEALWRELVEAAVSG
jgi:aromatic-L-amino-acid/L-tryptophan decarboxylase